MSIEDPSLAICEVQFGSAMLNRYIETQKGILCLGNAVWLFFFLE